MMVSFRRYFFTLFQINANIFYQIFLAITVENLGKAKKNQTDKHDGDESVRSESDLELSVAESPRADAFTDKSIEADMES